MEETRVSELAPDELRRRATEEEKRIFENAAAASGPTSDTLLFCAAQKRFLDALNLGIAGATNQHIAVVGLENTNVEALDAIARYIKQRVPASSESVTDWCVLHNFDGPSKPMVISLPCGHGKKLKERFQSLLEELDRKIHEAILCSDVINKEEALDEQIRNWQGEELDAIQRRAAKRGVSMKFDTRGNINIRPLVEETKERAVKSPPKKETDAYRDAVSKVIREYKAFLRTNTERKQGAVEKKEEIERAAVEEAIERAFEKIRIGEHQDAPRLIEYFHALKQYAFKNYKEIFMPQDNENFPRALLNLREDLKLPWKANVLVENSASEIPVIVEPHPTHENLVGKVEMQPTFGALYTDHTMIQEGAVARANGGYLILPLYELCSVPGVYGALKRVIKTGSLVIEPLATSLGMDSYVSLRPAPIPTRLKIIVAGPRYLWHLLARHDDEFLNLFGIKAEVDWTLPRNDSELGAYASWIKAHCEKHLSRQCDTEAIGKIIEHAARCAENQNFLSTDEKALQILLRETDYAAGKRKGQSTIQAEDVEKALNDKFYRSTLVYDYIHRLIRDGILRISCTGSAVGQVNALSVLSLGDTTVGRPCRLTVQIFPGKPGAINIEREAKLADPTFIKADFIVRSYLNAKYGKRPLSLIISIAFEQNYHGIGGDSASLAELYAMLSSIANVPIRHDRAVTGSLNQWGEVQAVGGLNEKIEGFFDVCTILGELTGTQGVIIPHSNCKNLMLREDVVRAVEKGKFHVWPIRTTEEGVKLLMGVEAGTADSDGGFQDGTLNAHIVQRLQEFNSLVKEH